MGVGQGSPTPRDGTPVGETDAVYADTTVRVALEVELEAGFHVNANTPLDEALIPTVLTLEPPEGVTLEGVAFPEPILFSLVGQEDDPLAVFDH